MLRLIQISMAMLVCLSGCTTVTDGPGASAAEVRQIADAEVRRTKGDLRRYTVSEPRRIPGEDCWSVAYYLEGNKRAAFAVRVCDRARKVSVSESDVGVFDGALYQKSDFH